MGGNVQGSTWKQGNGLPIEPCMVLSPGGLTFYVSTRSARRRIRSRRIGSLRRLVLHAVFQRAEALADAFAKLRKLLRPEDKQGDGKDQQ